MAKPAKQAARAPHRVARNTPERAGSGSRTKSKGRGTPRAADRSARARTVSAKSRSARQSDVGQKTPSQKKRAPTKTDGTKAKKQPAPHSKHARGHHVPVRQIGDVLPSLLPQEPLKPLVIPAGAPDGALFSSGKGMIWQPSGRGITFDFSAAIEEAVQLYCVDIPQPDTPEWQQAAALGLQEPDVVEAVLDCLCQRWCEAAGGKPGLSYGDVEGFRSRFEDWFADWRHVKHGPNMYCDRCARDRQHFMDKDGQLRTANVYKGVKIDRVGWELIAELQRLRGFVEGQSPRADPAPPQPWKPPEGFVGSKTICNNPRFRKEDKNPPRTTLQRWAEISKPARAVAPDREVFYPEEWVMSRIAAWRPRTHA